MIMDMHMNMQHLLQQSINTLLMPIMVILIRILHQKFLLNLMVIRIRATLIVIRIHIVIDSSLLRMQFKGLFTFFWTRTFDDAL